MPKKTTVTFLCAAIVLEITGASFLFAQTAAKEPSPLPESPSLHLASISGQENALAASTAAAPQESSSSSAGTEKHLRLTRLEAEQLAIKNNPRISIARLLALAQHQVVRETRAAELPVAMGSITAVDAENGSRISSGTLTASRLIEHAGAGGNFSQLITDFGRTRNLVASSRLESLAQDATAMATTEDIVLAADQAFYDALQAKALLHVAEQTVATRGTTETQINQLAKNKLKSTLDLSFAEVNLSQAKLLQLDAQNNADSTMAALDAVLGLDKEVIYDLIEDDEPLQPPSPNLEDLLQLALEHRPDLQALNYNRQAAVKFSHAQKDQMLPSINALGTAGSVPVRPGEYYPTSWWGGIGVNVNIPIFNGFLYSAQAKEAALRAQSASERSRDLRDQIVRDVRTSWLAANTALLRVTVAGELAKQANLALSLAQTRYQLGLSSIVEFSEAQLQQTDAAIGNTNAQYQYRLALAVLNYQIGTAP